MDHLHYGEFPQGGEVGSFKDGVENSKEKKDRFFFLTWNVFEVF